MQKYKYNRYNRRSKGNRLYKPKKKKTLICLIFLSKWFWLSFLVLFLLGSCFYLLIFASFFQIKEIKINNDTKIPTEEFRDIAEKYILKRIFFWDLKSIFLVDAREINQAVLDKFPQIARIETNKNFPNTLNLKIEKKQGVGIYSLDSHNFYYIDQQGIIFKKVESSMPQGILIIKDSSRPSQNFELGEKVIEENRLNQILTIDSKLKNDFNLPFKQIFIVSDKRLDVETLEGWDIYFNSAQDINWQLDELNFVLSKRISSNARTNLEYIDLRFEKIYIFPSTCEE